MEVSFEARNVGQVDATEFYWNLGDLLNRSRNFTHQYDESGIFNVTLRGESEDGGASDTVNVLSQWRINQLYLSTRAGESRLIPDRTLAGISSKLILVTRTELLFGSTRLLIGRPSRDTRKFSDVIGD